MADQESLLCGWGPFKPKWLQKLHNSISLIIVLSVMCAIQGMVVNGFISTSITTLEKRFDLQSTESGLLASMYDIGYLLVVIPVSYYGGVGHKGRWLGYGTGLMGLGSFVFSLPQFLSDDYVIGQRTGHTCNDANSTQVDCDETNYTGYYLLFVLGQLMHGMGCAAMYTLGYTYIDENVAPHNSALATGIFFTTSAVGPAIGYLLGGYFLTIYGDTGSVDLDKITIGTDDPRWYGAWWIGFLLSGSMGIITAFLILGFARELPGSKAKQASKVNEAHSKSGDKVVNTKGFGTKLCDLPTALKHLLCNPTYICFMLGASLDNFLINGFITFFPKYMEHQFAMSSSTSAFYSGLVVVLGVVVGCMGCAIAMSYLKMSCRQILWVTTIVVFLSMGGFIGFAFSCNPPPYAGILTQYPHYNSSDITLDVECNEHCGCSLETYEPVCMNDQHLYYSPCHAGCIYEHDNDTFSGCSCLPSMDTLMHLSSDSHCQPACTSLYIFLTLVFFLISLTMMAGIAVVQVTLRIVPFSQRSLAMGLGWVFARILGSIPGPICMGALIDLTCELWGEKCDKKTSCVAYNKEEMRNSFIYLPLVVRIVTFVLLLVGTCLYRPIDEHEDKEQFEMPHVNDEQESHQQEVPA